MTGRGDTLPSAPTTITLSPCEVRVTACCGSTMPSLTCACSMRTRTYMPGSSRPPGLGSSARKVIWPEVASTVRSLNSSLPIWPYSLPSSSTTRTLAACAPGARASLPLSSALRRRSTSVVDWVKFTYIGFTCCTTASGVASPWPTSAPSVTSERPMRPAMGELTDA